MIHEVKIRNFLSFRDEVKFSFEASNDNFAQEYQTVEMEDGVRLLRYAILYGYNASGKSNLLRVFDFLYDFWTSKSVNLDDPIRVIPFQLNGVSQNMPSYFEIVFYVGSRKYCYQLELDNHCVYKENLCYYKHKNPIMLFERTLENGHSVILFNTTDPDTDKISKAAKDEINIKCLKNLSFFVARNQVNVSLPLIDAAKDWFKSKVMRIITSEVSLTHFASRKLYEDTKVIEYILSIIKEADFNITNILSNIIERKVTEDIINNIVDDDFFSKDEKERIKKEKTIKHILTLCEHTVNNENGAETYNLPLQCESFGTMRVLGLETALYTVLSNEGFLPIDEIETSLHTKLLEKVLYEYLKTPKRSQILIATHHDGLLDLVDDLIRKDAVWFTEKKDSGVTELYKLIDFKGIDEVISFREAYKNKRFGATMNS